MRKLTLFLCVFFALAGFCADLQEWPFSASENGAWNVASPRVSVNAETDVQQRVAKKAMDYGLKITNGMSVAIQRVPNARLCSVSSGDQMVEVCVQDTAVCYAGEWSDREIAISLSAGQTNRFHVIGHTPTSAVPAVVSHLFMVAHQTPCDPTSGERPIVTACPGNIYLAEIKYFPFLNMRTRLSSSNRRLTAAKDDIWLKASVYVSESRILVCCVDVVGWGRSTPLRNAGAWAFCCKGEEPKWTASTKVGQYVAEDMSAEPWLHADMCIDSRRSIRIFVGCDGLEGRVNLDKYDVKDLFGAINVKDVLQ